ncbi:MAG: ribonucleoside-diphosphate reductase subunit alpha [Methylacidiphilaceae bacterium]|nr:ribonucleoside-diphosphate reductase subunit alpha [Candidatus Methylacidiphilaceae bacterium]
MISLEDARQLELAGIEPLSARTFTVQKRNGAVVAFEPKRISWAVERAFRAEHGVPLEQVIAEDLKSAVAEVTRAVVGRAVSAAVAGEALEVERIQDWVETALMEEGYHAVARRYILYRAERRRARTLRAATQSAAAPFSFVLRCGERVPLDPEGLGRELEEACRGLEERCSWKRLAEETLRSLYDGVSEDEIDQAMILAARSRVEEEPAYTYVAARILLAKLYRETLPEMRGREELQAVHRNFFPISIRHGVEVGRLSPKLLSYDLERLAGSLRMERDRDFTYMGLQTVYDRYLLHHEERKIETPQYFWMRVAMGLALAEKENREAHAIEFYERLSSFSFLSSTPTLFNSGTLHPQLSSCYLLTVSDDLDGIFQVISDNARLSKWAGGLGNDWTSVRATGSLIRGTNGRSQGVIPFLKVANDTAVAVNQGGKRKGAVCAYLETWHLDIEDFLELRRNTGDERRRTPDMNTANWIPDLFMKRVMEGGNWTLFSPSEVPDLHDLYGKAFERRYCEYEEKADRGEIRNFRRVAASTLWRKMLTMLFETGHPWITFKDPSNLRSPQDHVGVIHNSNLCTEITLNTSSDETAVCNLGSINLVAHVKDGALDEEELAETIRVAVRMLDNVIDINFYPTPAAKNANLRHRPVGLGLMGFQDALYRLKISYGSLEAVEFADRTMEIIAYHALIASADLARERGAYSTFPGSKWDRGLLPIDTLSLLEEERGGNLDVDRTIRKDWEEVRKAIRKHGLRNSNLLAIAPTATISNISGVSPSIEPTYKNLFVKSNLSGDFTTINSYLVEDLRQAGLWDQEMVDDLKFYDGSVFSIERIPQEIRERYLTAFELDPRWLIESASRRQKWIDMAQSLNLYIAEPNGKKLSDMYFLAWRKGLKTTYYLRAVAATSVEKSTLDINARGLQPRWMKSVSPSSRVRVDRPEEQNGRTCSLDNPECESCQ